VSARQPPARSTPKAEDQSSFSRYFDLERFEDTPAGQ